MRGAFESSNVGAILQSIPRVVSTRMPPPSESPVPASVDVLLCERVESGEFELPVLPETAAQVLTLSQDVACETKDVAALIERDQSLAAHVLRMANSVAFSPAQPIVSLQQGITRLGLSTLCEITVAVVVKGTVFKVPGFERALRDLWRHSSMTGVFAKEIARTVRRNVEGAFLCGLLHDIGKPVTLSFLPEICKATSVELSAEIGEAAMERHHSLIGGVLMGKWGLAPWVETAATYHHDYANARDHKISAMVTCLADHLAHWAMQSRDISEEDLFELPVVADLDLYEGDLTSLLAERDRAIEMAETFL